MAPWASVIDERRPEEICVWTFTFIERELLLGHISAMDAFLGIYTVFRTTISLFTWPMITNNTLYPVSVRSEVGRTVHQFSLSIFFTFSIYPQFTVHSTSDFDNPFFPRDLARVQVDSTRWYNFWWPSVKFVLSTSSGSPKFGEREAANENSFTQNNAVWGWDDIKLTKSIGQHCTLSVRGNHKPCTWDDQTLI